MTQYTLRLKCGLELEPFQHELNIEIRDRDSSIDHVVIKVLIFIIGISHTVV